MRNPMICRAFAGALLVVATLGTVSVSAARPSSAPVPASIAGTVQTIDFAKKKITIKTSVGTSVQLGVVGSTSITRNGAPGVLKDLTLNDAITAQYRVSKLVATVLAATGPAVTSIAGKATKVSFASGALTVGTTQLQTSASTRVARNGNAVALRSITLRDSIVAHTSAGTNVALDVVASGPNEIEVRGFIAAIVGNTVTVAPDDGSAPVTVSTGSSTVIEVNDQPGTLADLQVTQTVEVEYDPTTLVAFSISAVDESEDAEVEGTVASVDKDAGTVTITPQSGGSDITLFVNAATRMDVNDAPGALADIAQGMPIKAEYVAGTMLATEIEAGKEED